METTVNINLLKTISFIYDESFESKLSDELFKKIDSKLEELAKYFNVSKNKAFLLAHIFVFNCIGDCVDINDLGKYFDCNPIRLLEYHNDLIELTKMGFLIKKRSRHRFVAQANDQFNLKVAFSNAIIQNHLLPDVKPEVYNNLIDILEKIYSIGKERYERNYSREGMFEEMNVLLLFNNHIPFIKKLKQINLDDENTYLFLYTCWKTIAGNEVINLDTVTDVMFGEKANKAFYIQGFISRENDLIKKILIQTDERSFFNDTEIKLADKAIELLQSENIKLYCKASKKDNILCPDKIGIKKLFFNEKEQKQINVLESMLKNRNLIKLQNRLKDKILPTGLTVLLYGVPGTGKTETVLQIAKKTGREIMKVDISQSKSMWFGESEKVIKRIFTDYNELLKNSKVCPILFFNEADAIFSKRKNVSSSNVAQTENAIQNIILEEMENFKGILFATTNLTDNLDKAFERRFLFKVEMSKPDEMNRAKIWKSKLKTVKLIDCKLLAEKFDFSGGQIDNIVRKYEMHEVISGKTPLINEIIDFCNEELIIKEVRIKMGFKTNK